MSKPTRTELGKVKGGNINFHLISVGNGAGNRNSGGVLDLDYNVFAIDADVKFQKDLDAYFLFDTDQSWNPTQGNGNTFDSYLLDNQRLPHSQLRPLKDDIKKAKKSGGKDAGEVAMLDLGARQYWEGREKDDMPVRKAIFVRFPQSTEIKFNVSEELVKARINNTGKNFYLELKKLKAENPDIRNIVIPDIFGATRLMGGHSPSFPKWFLEGFLEELQKDTTPIDLKNIYFCSPQYAKAFKEIAGQDPTIYEDVPAPPPGKGAAGNRPPAPDPQALKDFKQKVAFMLAEDYWKDPSHFQGKQPKLVTSDSVKEYFGHIFPDDERSREEKLRELLRRAEENKFDGATIDTMFHENRFQELYGALNNEEFRVLLQNCVNSKTPRVDSPPPNPEEAERARLVAAARAAEEAAARADAERELQLTLARERIEVEEADAAAALAADRRRRKEALEAKQRASEARIAAADSAAHSGVRPASPVRDRTREEYKGPLFRTDTDPQEERDVIKRLVSYEFDYDTKKIKLNYELLSKTAAKRTVSEEIEVTPENNLFEITDAGDVKVNNKVLRDALSNIYAEKDPSKKPSPNVRMAIALQALQINTATRGTP